MAAISGTYDYNLNGADLALEVLERCDIRSPAIVPEMMTSLRRSINLVQATWTNRGVNLWKVQLETVTLAQGVATYNVPKNTIMMLDVYLRNYLMNGPTDVTVDFSTVSGSSTVTIGFPDNGMVAGQYINVVIPVSVGGIVVFGFYQVNSVPGTNQVTVIANDVAAATVNNGGAVPVFTTTGGSAAVNVELADHGYTTGDSFVVQVSTSVGGISLAGSYTVVAAVDADNFTITSPYVAGYVDSQTENGGEGQLAAQLANTQAFDRVMTPISRTDYSSLPNKLTQAPPTQYWFDRQAFVPQFTTFPVADGNGPYSLQYYRVVQIEDAGTTIGDSYDVPYRFLESLCADTAAHMAMKWVKDQAKRAELRAYASAMWTEAAAEDRERVPSYIIPTMEQYFP